MLHAIEKGKERKDLREILIQRRKMRNYTYFKPQVPVMRPNADIRQLTSAGLRQGQRQRQNLGGKKGLATRMKSVLQMQNGAALIPEWRNVVICRRKDQRKDHMGRNKRIRLPFYYPRDKQSVKAINKRCGRYRRPYRRRLFCHWVDLIPDVMESSMERHQRGKKRRNQRRNQGGK